MINANEICTDVQILNFINVFKKIITIGTIIVPVILIIFIIIDIIKAIGSAELDTKKMSKSIIKRITSAVIVFLVPVIIDLILSIIPLNTLYYIDCYKNASKQNIIYIAENNAIQSITKLNNAILNAAKTYSKNSYNEALLLYEDARIDVKKIPDKKIRSEKQKSLDNAKMQLNNIKAALKDQSIILDINKGEGNYQSTANPSKYDYDYVEKNLKKYNINQDRKKIVLTAASYVGQIPYYWGGYASSSNFKANNFGSPITDDGYGRNKKGLDCSHFVDFVFWQAINDNLENGNTVTIWNKSEKISENELLPGDIGFENDYDNNAKDNHVGIYAGKDDNGNKIWIHLAGEPNNNVVINNRKLTYYRRILN